MASSNDEFNESSINHTMKNWENYVSTTMSETFESSEIEFLNDFILSGKRIRARFCFSLALELGIKPEKVFSIAATAEVYHSATLIFDDIQDSSLKRRGKECYYITYGVPQGVALGALLRASMYLPIQKCSNLTESEKLFCYETFNRTCLDLCVGQFSEVKWVDLSPQAINTKDYVRMVKGKTGAIFAAISTLLAALSNLPEKSTRQMFFSIGESLGTIFQIRDDILNLISARESYDKDLLCDIQERKLTLMVIHCLNVENTYSQKLLDVLQADEITIEHQQRYLECLNENGSISYAKDFMADEFQAIKATLENYLPHQFQNSHSGLLNQFINSLMI